MGTSGRSSYRVVLRELFRCLVVGLSLYIYFGRVDLMYRHSFDDVYIVA